MASNSTQNAARTNAEQSASNDEFRVSDESEFTLYFLGEYDRGPVKIGYARDMQRRLASIQNSCPVSLTLLAIQRGGREAERAYHQRFAKYRLHGEWFERSPEILAEMQRINDEGRARLGYPPAERRFPA